MHQTGLSRCAHAAPGLWVYSSPVCSSQLIPGCPANRSNCPPNSSESQGSAALAPGQPQQVGTGKPRGMALSCAVLCLTKPTNKKCLLCAGSHVVLPTAPPCGCCRPHIQVTGGGLYKACGDQETHDPLEPGLGACRCARDHGRGWLTPGPFPCTAHLRLDPPASGGAGHREQVSLAFAALLR